MNLGIPDLLVAIPDVGFVMLELKVVTAGLKIDLSPHQYSFHIKHAKLGCPTFVVVEVNKKTRAELLLFSGAQVAVIVERGILADCVGRWPLANIDWEDFHQRVLQTAKTML